ncbi:MAG TPA: putative metal-binding motif-containing protein [Pyrinomonadaceae bacterium]|nr:putative metal-binding motif-containing protein [Pyrinomonadaceae bacterium]
MKIRYASPRLLLLALACLCFSKSASAQAVYPPSETIAYQSFDHGTLTLRAFSGRHIRYALPASWLEGGGVQGLTPAVLVSLIERTDAVYEKMTEIVGSEPKGTGLMTIGVTPLSSAEEGVAVAGTKRLEVAERIRDRVKVALAEGRLHDVITHEMAHSFAIYTPYFNYYPDAGHAWTDFWIPYSEYLLRTGTYQTSPEFALKATVYSFTRRWDALGTSTTWTRCVKPGTGCESEGIIANRVYAGLLLRYARLHGQGALRRTFDFYNSYNATHDSNEVFNFTAEQKNDLLAEALSFGINGDISGELDAWFWPISPATREKLRLIYPQPNPFSQDVDGDGWSPVRGDLDDHDATVHPGAVEQINGKDDDCNGFVDDVTRPAGPTLFMPPAKLVGRLRPEQSESYRFEGTGEFIIQTRATRGEWGGMVELRRAGDVNLVARVGIVPDFSILVLRLDSTGPWEIKVFYNQTSGPEGDYEVVIAPTLRGEMGVGSVLALPLRGANSAREHVLVSNALARAVGTLRGANAAAADARPDGQGRWPTTLSGIEVSVAGQAATVLAVRVVGGDSYSVDFVVPMGVTPAAVGARIPVVVRHMSSGAQWRFDNAELLESAPVLWSRETSGQAAPLALALESPTLVAFDESHRVPTDNTTRVMLFIGGLGSGRTSGNTRLVAQLADGRRVPLPIEYVGDTSLPGLQQIIFKVDAALSGQPRVLFSVEGGEEAWVVLHLR